MVKRHYFISGHSIGLLCKSDQKLKNGTFVLYITMTKVIHEFTEF